MIFPLKDLKIISFDPGESTGIVAITNGKVVWSMTVDRPTLDNFLANRAEQFIKADVWVVEQFLLYPWSAQSLSFNSMIPSRIIGSIELAAKQNNIPLELQNAQAAKAFSTDDKLNEFGWLQRLHTRHEKDAARHALFFLGSKVNAK